MSEYYFSKDEERSVIQYDISVIPNDFNVMTINTLLEQKIIEIPVFQRNFVWDKKRASKFIESLILGLPVPQLFFYQKEKNKYIVIDGQQRLFTIYFFLKKRFPKKDKRAYIRKIFNQYGEISKELLMDNTYFQDFKLSFDRLENGEPHILNNKNYDSLEEQYRSGLDLTPIRCMSIRQNDPKDDESIYEIFSRLNTGGVNLSAQEIRSCLYHSDFYNLLAKLNENEAWRRLLGKKDEDDKFRDREIILRGFALAEESERYNGAMSQFLNSFSKKAQLFNKDKIKDYENIFENFLLSCKDLNNKDFLTKNNKFNVSLYDAIFSAVVKKYIGAHSFTSELISREKIINLKRDEEFINCITHSTSHVDNVHTRIKLAEKYLFSD